MQRKCSKKDTKHNREEVEGPLPRGRDGKRLSLSQSTKRTVYKIKTYMVVLTKGENRKLEETGTTREKRSNEEK